MKEPAICNCKRLLKLNLIARVRSLVVLFIFCLVPTISQVAQFADKVPFRLHVLKEPYGLDPQIYGATVHSYLLQNLHRGLFKYDNDKGLVPDLAEKCSRRLKNLQLTCTLKKDLRWSDGSPLTAKDFVSGIEFLLTRPQSLVHVSGITKLKNANSFAEGKFQFDKVGVKAINDLTLQFEFNEPEPEFEYSLCQTALSPRPSSEKQFSGPYQLKEWKKNQSLLLTKNSHYPAGENLRPDVEFLFITEDSSALKLYEKKQLDFLRRLPTALYKEWSKKPDFQSFEILRFDYFGFNKELSSLEHRKQLSESLDYEDLQKIFQSIGRPGCVALPGSFFKKDLIPCVNYRNDSLKNKLTWPKDMVIGYSSQGGDDHRRVAEWLQSQWKKKLGLNFRIQGMENKVFLSRIKDRPPTVFRKGVSLERPTCLAAVEIFSREHPENFLKVDSPEFEKILQDLKQTSEGNHQKELCSKAVNWLLDQNLLIPTGRFDFFTLLNPSYTGLKLNLMNQLFLEDLRSVSIK